MLSTPWNDFGQWPVRCSRCGSGSAWVQAGAPQATKQGVVHGPWPLGSSGNGSKHGEPVDRENFIALSAQNKLGVNGFKTNVLLLWSGG